MKQAFNTQMSCADQFKTLDFAGRKWVRTTFCKRADISYSGFYQKMKSDFWRPIERELMVELMNQYNGAQEH